MHFLFLLAVLVFCRKSRFTEEKFLQQLQDLIDDLEDGIGDFEEQVGNLESFDSDDFVEEALGDSYESDDEFDLASLYSESDESYSDSEEEDEVSVGEVLKQNVEHWLYRYLASEMGVYDSSEEAAVGSDSYSSSDSEEYDSNDFDLDAYDSDDFESDEFDDSEEYAVGDVQFDNMYDSADIEYLESVVGNPDNDWSSDVEDFDDIYNPEDSPDLFSGDEIAVGESDIEYFDDIYESEDSPDLYPEDEVALGGSDEFYEDIPTPGEEYAVGGAALDETIDKDEVPVDELYDLYTDDEEEAVGDIYDLGDYVELFEDPEEIPVASHGFDFLQELDPYFEEETH